MSAMLASLSRRDVLANVARQQLRSVWSTTITAISTAYKIFRPLEVSPVCRVEMEDGKTSSPFEAVGASDASQSLSSDFY